MMLLNSDLATNLLQTNFKFLFLLKSSVKLRIFIIIVDNFVRQFLLGVLVVKITSDIIHIAPPTPTLARARKAHIDKNCRVNENIPSAHTYFQDIFTTFSVCISYHQLHFINNLVIYPKTF